MLSLKYLTNLKLLYKSTRNSKSNIIGTNIHIDNHKSIHLGLISHVDLFQVKSKTKLQATNTLF